MQLALNRASFAHPCHSHICFICRGTPASYGIASLGSPNPSQHLLCLSASPRGTQKLPKMRRKKHKHTRRSLRHYRITHGFRPPYKVLLDGNFVHALDSMKCVHLGRGWCHCRPPCMLPPPAAACRLRAHGARHPPPKPCVLALPPPPAHRHLLPASLAPGAGRGRARTCFASSWGTRCDALPRPACSTSSRRWARSLQVGGGRCGGCGGCGWAWDG